MSPVTCHVSRCIAYAHVDALPIDALPMHTSALHALPRHIDIHTLRRDIDIEALRRDRDIEALRVVRIETLPYYDP